MEEKRMEVVNEQNRLLKQRRVEWYCITFSAMPTLDTQDILAVQNETTSNPLFLELKA